MEIENLSDRILGKPKVHVRCGWKDDKLGWVYQVDSREKDAILFHNFYKPMRSSCGTVSWQVTYQKCFGFGNFKITLLIDPG